MNRLYAQTTTSWSPWEGWTPHEGLDAPIDSAIEARHFQIEFKHYHEVSANLIAPARPCGAWFCCKTGPLSTTFCKLARTKEELLANLLETTRDTQLRDGYCRAAEEAAAIAWTTSYPLLVFPVLLEEKADQARRYYEQQRKIRNRTQACYTDLLYSAC